MTGVSFLFDTNVLIALDPFAGRLNDDVTLAARLHRLLLELRCSIVVHPANRADIEQDRDDTRRGQQLAELGKYPMLVESPVPRTLRQAVAKTFTPGSNDDRDLRLLSAVVQRAASFLVTDDRQLRRWARRAGVAERVLRLADAVSFLEDLIPAPPRLPPRVETVPGYALDDDQDVFVSLRAEYDGFDRWLTEKVRADPDGRRCYVVREPDGAYGALAIVKLAEGDCSYAIPQPVSKIATLKVADDSRGSKLGELLLKTVFADAHERGVVSLYVEVFERHSLLVDTLGLFGFETLADRSSRGELVLAKRLAPPAGAAPLAALHHHVLYGPPAVAPGSPVFAVPILPSWHDELFPDAPALPDPPDAQPGLFEIERRVRVTHPWGNALRKAYLSLSRTTRLNEGDTLLFYESKPVQAVRAVGVVEETLRSRDPNEIVAFVGQRTVYSVERITAMCREGVDGVLAVLFRQDRFIDPPWELSALQANGVIASWPPQAISLIPDDRAAWVRTQLAG